MLADLKLVRESKLRADFQQFYNLDIDRMGTAYSVRHAAALLAELPPEARLYGVSVRRNEAKAEGMTSEELMGILGRRRHG